MSLKTYVEVNLNGKTKLLKYDFNAVADVEEYFNKGIGAIFNEEQVGLNTLRVFYWAGLKWKDRGITPQVCGTWLGEKLKNKEATMEDLMKPIFKALKISGVMGELEDEEDLDDEEENEGQEVKN